MMLRNEETRTILGGHEKFVFRNGWLKKGFDAVNKDPHIFNRDESLVLLGVGKNMVRSIRHWCLATNIIQEKQGDGPAKHICASEFGTKLLSDNGWDPFLEDMGSLWLIHWQLVSNRTRSLVWSIVFSSYFQGEFSKSQITHRITKRFEHSNVRTTPGTIENEIDVFFRMYVPSISNKKRIFEENLDCPLAYIDLIQAIPEEGLYRFNIGPKSSLSVFVFGYALFHFLSKRLQTRRTVSIDEILYQNDSPGQAFKLNEDVLVNYLEQLEEVTAGAIRINETAGLKQIYLKEDISAELINWSNHLLDQYYGRN